METQNIGFSRLYVASRVQKFFLIKYNFYKELGVQCLCT